MIEVTIGEVKSNADVSGACRQLSVALAVVERVVCVLAAPRTPSATRERAPLPAAADQASQPPSPPQAARLAAASGVESPGTPAVSDAEVAPGGAAACGSPGPALPARITPVLDYRLTGLIFAAKASASYAAGRGLELASDVHFVDRSKTHICVTD